MNRLRRTVRLRLLLVGLVVVGGSVGSSMLFTHLSFQFGDGITYRDAMIAALVIPLLVSPTAYGWIAFLNYRLYHSNAALDRLARQDELTGLFNRRAFFDIAAARMAGEEGLQLLIADIDHFKRINDSMGHAAGDLALVHAAHVFRDCLGPEGTVARIGGEEFALLVPASVDVPALLECIADHMANMPVLAKSGMGRLTCSYGLAKVLPGEPLGEVLSRADKALYAAKDGGRDRLALAS